MAVKYLLSTGVSTGKVEYYILDLFRIALQVAPSDIPHQTQIGFDFTLTDSTKDSLLTDLRFRTDSLVKNIKERFRGIQIGVQSIELYDETKAKLVITVSTDYSEEYYVDIYNNQE